jgi:putative transposase
MRKQEFLKINHCVFDLKVHLVLVTKYRRKCINKTLLSFLEENFGRLLEQWACILHEFNGEPDHVLLLIGLNPSVQPSKLVNNLKTVTSRLVRKEFEAHLKKFFWKPVFWSRSYCIASCGGAPLAVLKQYIENQAGAE